ncbi:MAG: DUF5337 domain-containing protein [Rhodobacterales bacterium]|nr:DUF5337 domain-containing protein [Rhodobacterales bacterium]
MTTEQDTAMARAGRRAALVMAGTALFWIAVHLAEDRLGLSNRMMALLELFALAGFGLALWMTYQVWRMRQNTKR